MENRMGKRHSGINATHRQWKNGFGLKF